MYAFVKSSTGDVWSASSTEYTVGEIVAITGLDVDLRIDNCPDRIQARASKGKKYHRWLGTGGTSLDDYEFLDNPEYLTPVGSLLNDAALVVDTNTGVIGDYLVMQTLVNRRELFNDPENPLYIPGKVPVLGDGGVLQDQENKTSNLENIHSKLAWHRQEIIKAAYHGPEDLLIYYGWPNSFNYDYNAWTNEWVAQDMARYDMIVFGAGLEDPGHGGYADTAVIIARIAAINPGVQMYGYVTANQPLVDFKTQVDQWEALQIDGIFMDECGYDYGLTRSDFNSRINYVHGQTVSHLCFCNAWNFDHILGTANDPGYPNSTYNQSLTASNLTANDWVLLESLAVNTASYTGAGQNGHEDRDQWALRIGKATLLRSTYGINLAAGSVIANGHAAGNNLNAFAYVSALMGSLDAYGSSDVGYGAGSAIVKKWNTPDIKGLRPIWNLNPSIQLDGVNTNLYRRFLDNGKLSIDFSLDAQQAWITPPPGKIIENYGYEDFTAESSKDIIFGNLYVNDVVSIVLTPGGNINSWVDSVTTTGFTIHLSTAWTGRVYWYAKGN